MNTNKGPVMMVKRGEFRTLRGQRMVVILNTAGEVELYCVDTDGIEMFAGYIKSPFDARWITGAEAALDRAAVVRYFNHIEPNFKCSARVAA